MTIYEKHCIESVFSGVLIKRYLAGVDHHLFWGDKCQIDDDVVLRLRAYLSALGAEEYIAHVKMEAYTNYHMIAWELFDKFRQTNKDEAYRQGHSRFY